MMDLNNKLKTKYLVKNMKL